MRQQFVLSCLLACAVAGTLALPGRASASIVTNGGFEIGDFTGWTETGDTSFNGVFCPGVGSAPEGACEAFFGPVGTTGGIKQTLATTIGQLYAISFDYGGDGTAGSIEVDFGSQVLLFQIDSSAAMQTFTFTAGATSALTDLAFLFQDDQGFKYLDAVQANVPEPTSLALAGLALAGLAASRGRGRREGVRTLTPVSPA